jgi:hypothetical protein
LTTADPEESVELVVVPSVATFVDPVVVPVLLVVD